MTTSMTAALPRALQAAVALRGVSRTYAVLAAVGLGDPSDHPTQVSASLRNKYGHSR
jgi:hypothetical protein